MPTRKGSVGERVGSEPRASMGPRRCRRGRRTSAGSPTRCAGCFNGAASLPTRKVAEQRDATSGAYGASMGPRRCRRGRRSAALDGGLDLALASMGPRRCRRGRTLGPAPRTEAPQKLQWGRVVADAEGRVHRDDRRHEDPDASMGPRRCRRGRGLARCLAALCTLASMGPRRCRRGRPSAWKSGTFDASFNGAASLPTRKDVRCACTRRGASRFNGAASLPTRKDRRGSSCRARCPASMGPRRCRRGRPSGRVAPRSN